jgi:hypothetical protein
MVFDFDSPEVYTNFVYETAAPDSNLWGKSLLMPAGWESQ